jgi:hypothetical protein
MHLHIAISDAPLYKGGDKATRNKKRIHSVAVIDECTAVYGSRVRFPVRMSTILSNVHRGFSQFLQANVGRVEDMAVFLTVSTSLFRIVFPV